jgi:hypothetical protein
MCNGLITGTCNQLVDDNELSIRASSNAQMFQDGEAIFVRPVVKHSGQEEDRDVLLLCRLWVKEAVAFADQMSECSPDDMIEKGKI